MPEAVLKLASAAPVVVEVLAADDVAEARDAVVVVIVLT